MATFMCHLLVAYKIDVAMLIWHKHILISMLTVLEFFFFSMNCQSFKSRSRCMRVQADLVWD